MAEAGNEALWRTNPVLCIDRLVAKWKRSDGAWFMCGSRLISLIAALSEQGIVLPPGSMDRWAPGRQLPASSTLPEPRVIGLAVDDSPTGHVFPLRPVRADDYWNVDGRLPFGHADILDVLTELVQVSGVAEKWSVPERVAFRFENATGLGARGESMTIAAVLAVLDCMTGFGLPLLRAATAVAQLAPGGALKAVGDIDAKLEAATRECGQLSLIICATGSEISRDSAAEVWEVQSLADLAARLHTAGLLAPLLDAVGPLDKRESARVLERLKAFDREQCHRAAADLGDRVWHCGFAEPVDPAVLTEFARLYAGACRYHGRFSDAVRVARDAYDRIAALGAIGCDDDEADAAAEYGASLFSAHRFDEIPRLLEPWASAAIEQPRRFRPLTRVKVWNTLARTLAVLGQNGWDELFGRSLTLCHQLKESGNVERTTHYRVHARLRRGDTVGAREALNDVAALIERGAGNPWAAFLHADLARLEGRLWSDPILDERLTAGGKPYPAWIYLQAVARQPRRIECDAIDRLRQAIALLRHECDGVEGNVCNLFAAMLELVVAARLADARDWATAVAKIEGFLETAAEHRRYYASATGALPDAPDVTAAENLLNAVPYF